MTRNCLLGLCLLLTTVGLFAQNNDYTLHLRKTAIPVKIDGVLDDTPWQTADKTSRFTQNFPLDTVLANDLTVVQVAFDEHFLYVAATCTQKRSQYTVQSLRRDFGPGTSDVFNVVISPFRDGLNGFLFGVSPLNVQREALIDNGDNISFDWDNRWTSAVHNEAEQWTVEMAIPFKTLRYSVAEGQNTWHINFVRTSLNPWEVSTWKPVSRQFRPFSLAFVANAVWDVAPPSPRLNMALIPFAAGATSAQWNRRNSDLALLNRNTDRRASTGGDAKIGITPSLNLDLTFNPDFSQVEVDRQVTNLERFELFFPERRQFFLENRDLFATFGFPMTRPFFSRRIGLAFNPVTRTNQIVPIRAGVRLSGKLNDDWRIGVLNMQTARVNFDENRALPAANFTVATLQRKVFDRSAISGILTNKQNFLNGLSEGQRNGTLVWNRVAGLEYNLYSKDNRWEGEAYYHRSFSPDPSKRGSTGAGFLGYRDRNLNANLGFVRIDSTYTADMGFVPRPGVQHMFTGLGWTFYPKKSYINTLRVGTQGEWIFDLGFKPTDRDVSLSANAEFQDQASANVGVYHNYTFLFDDFDPTNLNEAGTQPLPGARGYNYNGLFVEYFSSTSYNLQGSIELAGGGFFNGTFMRMNGELLYRIQPYGTIAMSYNYNRIRLPQPYASADLWLLGPRVEMAFTRNLFLSAFFQYNTQANNFNINTRFQWRFAPVSDVFLVYSDNSFAQSVRDTPVRFFTPKNRALVLKVVYWLAV